MAIFARYNEVEKTQSAHADIATHGHPQGGTGSCRSSLEISTENQNFVENVKSSTLFQ